MKRGRIGKFDTFVSLSRQRSIQILIAIALLYALLFTLEIPFVFRTAPTRSRRLANENDSEQRERVSRNAQPPGHRYVSGLVFGDTVFDSELYQSAIRAGKTIWEELKSVNPRTVVAKPGNQSGSCPRSVSVSGSDFLARGSVMMIPCGLTLGSHITVVGKPLAVQGKVSQFMMELQGLKTVEREEPPRILHFNPRLKGDWSGKPVIELNTCYRMQWGSALRCNGWKSRADEDTGEKI